MLPKKFTEACGEFAANKLCNNIPSKNTPAETLCPQIFLPLTVIANRFRGYQWKVPVSQYAAARELSEAIPF